MCSHMHRSRCYPKHRTCSSISVQKPHRGKRHRLLSLKLANVKPEKATDAYVFFGRGHTSTYTASGNDKWGHLPAAGMRCAPGTEESL